MKRPWKIGIAAVVALGAAGTGYWLWKSKQFPAPIAFLEKYRPAIEPTGDKYYSYDTIDDTCVRLYFREPYRQIQTEIVRHLVQEEHWIVADEWPDLPSVSYAPKKDAPFEVNIQPVSKDRDGYPEYKCIVVLSNRNNALQRWWWNYRYEHQWID